MNGYILIECLSDTCFSAPSARGVTTDTECVRDTLGLPTVSGKTLHGLLRDTFLSALSASPSINSNQIGYALLGRPRSLAGEGILRVGDGYLVDTQGNDLRPWVRFLIHDKSERGSPLPATALTDAFFKTRILTAEDRLTGAPKKEALRVIRVFPRGTVLKVPLQATRPLAEAEERLLHLLVKATRHAGLTRNRGLGLIRLSVAWEENSPLPTPTTSHSAAAPIFFLHYRLLLTAPCLIPDQDLDPNSRLTKLHLPGSALRGAAAAALAGRNLGTSVMDDIFASGTVDFLNAYPEVENKRSLPTPISWRRIKDAASADTENSVRPHDAASALLPASPASSMEWSGSDEMIFDADEDDVHSEQMQPVQTPYFASGDRAYIAREIPRRSTNHQRRHRRTGSTHAGGQETVFVYEALEAFQTFRGCVAVRSSEARGQILSLLDEVLRHDPLWIGRSLRSGYGAAPQVNVVPGPGTDAEAPVEVQELEEGELFSVCLTSDAVLRHPATGQHDPWRLQDVLQQRFEEVAEVEGVLVQAATVRGFSRLWRTELPHLPAAAAGSIARLRATRSCSRDELTSLQAEPIGERTADGYGRFLIRRQEDALVLTQGKASPPSSPHTELGRSSETLREAQRRLYMIRLRGLMGAHALDVAGRTSANSLPATHLLQRLRGPLRLAAANNGPPVEYAHWLSENPQTPNRLRERARRAVNNTWLGYGTLGDLLRAAAEPDWKLPRSPDEAEEQTRYRILPDAEAEDAWEEVRDRANLRLYYLGVLLSTLIHVKHKQNEPRQA